MSRVGKALRDFSAVKVANPGIRCGTGGQHALATMSCGTNGELCDGDHSQRTP